MTKILEQAIEKAERLSDNRQDEVGEILLSIVEQDASGVQLSAEQEAEVRRRMAAPRVYVSPDDMKAFFCTRTE